MVVAEDSDEKRIHEQEKRMVKVQLEQELAELCSMERASFKREL